MKIFFKAVFDIIFFIPNLFLDLGQKFFNFAFDTHLFFQIVFLSILSLVVGSFMLLFVGALVDLPYIIFNSSIGVDTSEFMKNNQYTLSFLLGLPFVLLFKYNINEREGRAIVIFFIVVFVLISVGNILL